QRELQGIHIRLAVAREPLGVGLLLLLGEPDQRAGDPEQLGPESAAALEVLELRVEIAEAVPARGDAAPVFRCGAELRLRGGPRAELGLRLELLPDDLRIEQAGEDPAQRLAAVLDAEEIVARDARLLFAADRELIEGDLPAVKRAQ